MFQFQGGKEFIKFYKLYIGREPAFNLLPNFLSRFAVNTYHDMTDLMRHAQFQQSLRTDDQDSLQVHPVFCRITVAKRR